MDLHPHGCGSIDFARDSSVVEIDGALATRYRGPCAGCGDVRELTFGVPPLPVAFPPEDHRYGDGRPSQLLDPGQWMWVADRYGGAAPWDPTADEGSREEARTHLSAALSAMNEVLAFVPAGGDLVPEDAVTSGLGRRVYAAEPGRFYLDRLEVVRDTYADLLLGTPR